MPQRSPAAAATFLLLLVLAVPVAAAPGDHGETALRSLWAFLVDLATGDPAPAPPPSEGGPPPASSEGDGDHGPEIDPNG